MSKPEMKADTTITENDIQVEPQDLVLIGHVLPRVAGIQQNVERTLALIKPDAVKTHKLEIIKKIKSNEFEIVQEKQVLLTKEQACEFYIEHEGKSFYETLTNWMSSEPIYALVLEKQNAIQEWRKLMGPTNSNKARESDPDSVRALFGTDGSHNATHGSDSIASAEREINILFSNEITDSACEPDSAEGASPLVTDQETPTVVEEIISINSTEPKHDFELEQQQSDETQNLGNAHDLTETIEDVLSVTTTCDDKNVTTIATSNTETVTTPSAPEPPHTKELHEANDLPTLTTSNVSDGDTPVNAFKDQRIVTQHVDDEVAYKVVAPDAEIKRGEDEELRNTYVDGELSITSEEVENDAANGPAVEITANDENKENDEEPILETIMYCKKSDDNGTEPIHKPVKVEVNNPVVTEEEQEEEEEEEPIFNTIEYPKKAGAVVGESNEQKSTVGNKKETISDEKNAIEPIEEEAAAINDKQEEILLETVSDEKDIIEPIVEEEAVVEDKKEEILLETVSDEKDIIEPIEEEAAVDDKQEEIVLETVSDENDIIEPIEEEEAVVKDKQEEVVLEIVSDENDIIELIEEEAAVDDKQEEIMLETVSDEKDTIELIEEEEAVVDDKEEETILETVVVVPIIDTVVDVKQEEVASEEKPADNNKKENEVVFDKPAAEKENDENDIKEEIVAELTIKEEADLSFKEEKEEELVFDKPNVEEKSVSEEASKEQKSDPEVINKKEELISEEEKSVPKEANKENEPVSEDTSKEENTKVVETNEYEFIPIDLNEEFSKSKRETEEENEFIAEEKSNSVDEPVSEEEEVEAQQIETISSDPIETAEPLEPLEQPPSNTDTSEIATITQDQDHITVAENQIRDDDDEQLLLTQEHASPVIVDEKKNSHDGSKSDETPLVTEPAAAAPENLSSNTNDVDDHQSDSVEKKKTASAASTKKALPVNKLRGTTTGSVGGTRTKPVTTTGLTTKKAPVLKEKDNAATPATKTKTSSGVRIGAGGVPRVALLANKKKVTTPVVDQPDTTTTEPKKKRIGGSGSATLSRLTAPTAASARKKTSSPESGHPTTSVHGSTEPNHKKPSLVSASNVKRAAVVPKPTIVKKPSTATIHVEQPKEKKTVTATSARKPLVTATSKVVSSSPATVRKAVSSVKQGITKPTGTRATTTATGKANLSIDKTDKKVATGATTVHKKKEPKEEKKKESNSSSSSGTNTTTTASPSTASPSTTTTPLSLVTEAVVDHDENNNSANVGDTIAATTEPVSEAITEGHGNAEEEKMSVIVPVVIYDEEEKNKQDNNASTTNRTVAALEEESETAPKQQDATSNKQMASLRSKFESLSTTGNGPALTSSTSKELRSKSPNRISDMINRFTK